MKKLLLLADENKYLKGFVDPNNLSKLRISIKYDNQLVGFFSPREEKDYMRIGAIYIKDQYRKNLLGFSIAEYSIKLYFKNKKVKEIVDADNIGIKALFLRCGFKFSEYINYNMEIWEN